MGNKNKGKNVDVEQKEICVHCTPGGLAHLAKMMAVVQRWIVAGMDVRVASVECDERGGILIGVIDGVKVCLEVPIR